METLKALSEALGVSGREAAVRKIVLDAIRPHVDSLKVDGVGNVLAVKKGTDSDNRPRVMLAAHMDEVGFMVTGADSDGLIRFAAVGGIDDRILPGKRVKVGADAIPGVIVWTPIHLNQDQNVVKISSLRIDIGASNKEEANGKAKRGERIAFDSTWLEIGDKVVRGKALDDRAGCSIVIDILRGGPYACDVLAAFTVQEEIGLRGAQVAARAFNPDAAFIFECTTANDIPNPLADPDRDDPRDLNPTTRMGEGPVFSIMDRSMITAPQMLNFLKATAAKHGITHGYKTMLGGGTDGGAIHKANTGVPTGAISLPGRYIHSPHAYIHRDDYARAVALGQAALNELTHEALKPL